MPQYVNHSVTLYPKLGSKTEKLMNPVQQQEYEYIQQIVGIHPWMVFSS